MAQTKIDAAWGESVTLEENDSYRIEVDGKAALNATVWVRSDSAIHSSKTDDKPDFERQLGGGIKLVEDGDYLVRVEDAGTKHDLYVHVSTRLGPIPDAMGPAEEEE